MIILMSFVCDTAYPCPQPIRFSISQRLTYRYLHSEKTLDISKELVPRETNDIIQLGVCAARTNY